jgi:hypothetical protein
MTKIDWAVRGLDPDAPISVNARAILRVRIAEFYHYEPIVADDRATPELHQLRIAAKRLRYTLELFADIFGESGQVQIERVKAVQEVLGNLHDCDVRIAMIEDELVELAGEQMQDLNRLLGTAPEDEHRSLTSSALRPPPDDPRRGLIALLSRQHAARRAAYAEFAKLWLKYGTQGMRAGLVKLSSMSTNHAASDRAGKLA